MVSLHIQRVTTMSEEIIKIASALDRIADALDRKWPIDIAHGHVDSIDNI